MFRPLAIIAVLAALATSFAPASAQVICHTMPPDSPVLSNSPDDIPPTPYQKLTYQGTYGPIQANLNFAFVEFGPNDQRVWFTPDTYTGVYYNRRTRADANSPWYWEFSQSPLLTTLSGSDPASSGAEAVLYSATPKYVDDRNGEVYEFIMFKNWQPSACNGVVGGFVYVAYSHDGICWTAPQAGVGGGPTASCYPWLTNPVQIEQVSAVDTGGVILVFYVEGNISLLAPSNISQRNTNMDRTQTYINYASYSAPYSLHALRTSSELSTSGIFETAYASDFANPRRYYPYRYFINLQVAWDAANGDLYIGRGYPYPYDRGPLSSPDTPTSATTPTPQQVTETYIPDPNSGQPTEVGGCVSSPATLPNRMQIYKMHLGTLSNYPTVTTGTWSLVFDIGNSSGYGNVLNGWVGTTPTKPGQSNYGRDWGAPSFMRDPTGTLVRHSGQAYLFGGDELKLSKSNGPCYVTGFEKQTLISLP